jgi:hypothetical protein
MGGCSDRVLTVEAFGGGDAATASMASSTSVFDKCMSLVEVVLSARIGAKFRNLKTTMDLGSD